MYKVGKAISKEELLPGDIVFFEGYASGPSHAVVFIGDGKFVHSPSTGKTVSIGSIDDPYYYGPRYYGARRVIQ
jgi:cell wall-associated NlpC family hydrolase